MITISSNEDDNWFDDFEDEPEIETEPEPIFLLCKWCKNKYMEDELKGHQKRCNKNPDNSYICEYCEKEILKKSKTRHLKTCKKNPDNEPKEPIIQMDNSILQNINDKIENVIDLAILGKIHKLTEDNMLKAIKLKGSVKLNDLRWFFSNSDNIEIDKMLKDLHKRKFLIKTQTNWFKINTKSKS